VRAEFYRPEATDGVVGSASWWGAEFSLSAASPEGREALQRIFRPTPVVVDDPSLRPFGTTGPAVLQPGSLQWFQAAARTRSPVEGLAVRFVADEHGAMGWDPAGAYRTFTEAIERRVLIGASAREREDDLRSREAQPQGRGAKPSQR
jgi:hypothetical protein